MKKQVLFALTGICLLLTACAEKTPAESAEPQTNPIITETSADIAAVTEQNMQNLTEIPATEEMLLTEAPAVPAEPSSPDALIGVWQNPDSKHVYWFQENGLYITMLYMGTFPEQIPIEMTETTVILTLEGEPVTLTQTGTHVFDTLDGLYNAEGKAYQILILGNMVYIYNNLNTAYSYNGEMLKMTDTESPCYISGDTAQIAGQTFIRTHDLDAFLF